MLRRFLPNLSGVSQGLEQYCAVRTSWTYNGREKDETPTYGGYSEKIVVDENYVLRIPGSLPLGCGCASALRWYHAVLAVEALAGRPGKKVAIVGMGGLGHMGVKLAHALGAEVTVLSQSLTQEGRWKTHGRGLLLRHVRSRDLHQTRAPSSISSSTRYLPT